MSLENSLLGQENNIIFETKERSVAEKEQALSEYCEKNNNPLLFLKNGQDYEEIDLADRWKKIDESEQGVLKMILEKAMSFLSSPAFTDTFHKDHGARRDWEDKYIEKNTEVDLVKYYHRNRFGINHLSLPFLFKSWLEAYKETSSLNDDLGNKSQQIVNNLILIAPDNLHNYSSLSDEEKYQTVERMELVFQDLINLLSDK